MSIFFRPVRVFFRLLPFVLSFLRDWRGFVLFGRPRRLTAAQHRSRAKRLTVMLAELGPAFIKGAQLLATREDILPRTYTEELSTLQDRVPPFPTKQALASIRRSLKRPAAEVFDSFDREPLAAASLGQVHRAVYRGQPVAVKILRPGVRQIVEADLAVVSFILRLFSLFVDSHFIRSFQAILAEYTRVIREEMDFHNEERNAARLRKNFASDPRVRVPECFCELTRTELCVFEYVEGARVDNPEALAEFGVSRRQLVDILIDVYVRMTVVHGFIHADPHPGNLLVDSAGRVVILDYGMVLEFPDKLRMQLLKACLAMVRNDLDTIVDTFYRLGMVDAEVNRSLVRDAAETLLEIQLREDFTPRMVQEIADDILQTFHAFPLRMPQQLVYLFRASALIEGLGIKYDPNFSAVREATPVIKRLIREVAFDPNKGPVERIKNVADDVVATFNRIQRIIERTEREEQHVRIHQADLADLRRNIGAAVRRLLLGSTAVAWFIAGVLLTAAFQTWWPVVVFTPPAMVTLILCVALPLRGRRP